MEVNFNLIYIHTHPKLNINANAQPIKHKEMTKLESRPSWRNSKIHWDGEGFIEQGGKTSCSQGINSAGDLDVKASCSKLNFFCLTSVLGGTSLTASVQGGVQNCYRGFTSRNNPRLGSLSHKVLGKALVTICNHFYTSKTVKSMHQGYISESKRRQPGACTDLSS